MSLYDDINRERQKMQSAYYESQQSGGINCPHCGERILVLVKNKKTSKMDACPACGKKVNVAG